MSIFTKKVRAGRGWGTMPILHNPAVYSFKIQNKPILLTSVPNFFIGRQQLINLSCQYFSPLIVTNIDGNGTRWEEGIQVYLT